jgi:general stress protein 26
MPRRFRLLISCSIVITALAVFAVSLDVFAQATQRDIDAFAKATLVYIATVRKDGNQSKSAPVWFTTTPDHVLVINTSPTSWKAKRIRRGSPAMVWIGSENGPAFIGKAEITSDPAVLNRIITDYPEKYLMARVGLFRPSQEKFDEGKVVAIKITPVRDLPDFVSQPGTPAPSLEPASSTTSAPH